MRNVLRSAENQQQNAYYGAVHHQDTTENRGDFKYDEALRWIYALGWSTDLCQLPELYFIQLYDYLVVSTHKYRHIVLKGTNYKKLKSYQFFFEGNVERLETKTHENRTYVKGSVVPSKKTPYRVVIGFTPQCDILFLASSSFSLFHDIKSHCSEESTSQEIKIKIYIYIYTYAKTQPHQRKGKETSSGLTPHTARMFKLTSPKPSST